ncbi:hypothetical protein LshimejAT787_0704420 [Lyophyllum shimeji]|uniref:Uncharacterized protein n=1 Tax=Lyophyllum shimeji TaxID=47721 RepID=A0A9P3PR92_LYOSH|nr:hypothetical protein LshimejAT787_0704420 [Lyophyllum shimeji]
MMPLFFKLGAGRCAEVQKRAEENKHYCMYTLMLTSHKGPLITSRLAVCGGQWDSGGRRRRREGRINICSIVQGTVKPPTTLQQVRVLHCCFGWPQRPGCT